MKRELKFLLVILGTTGLLFGLHVIFPNILDNIDIDPMVFDYVLLILGSIISVSAIIETYRYIENSKNNDKEYWLH
mgnify:CR=1 FL=1